jgi:hypothetical protein
MRKLVVCLPLVVLFMSGCALKVVPEHVDSGIINAGDNSQTLTKNGIAITASNSDTEIDSYNLEGTVSAFQVAIDNQSDREAVFDTDSFLLLDNDGRQYYPLTPEKVKEIISRDSYYLIPYPYVGFYYLEDYQKAYANNQFNSQVPYFYEVYPQDIYTRALPGGAIIPHAKVAGLVYFKIEMRGKRGVKLLLYRKGASKSDPPEFTFPFKVE